MTKTRPVATTVAIAALILIGLALLAIQAPAQDTRQRGRGEDRVGEGRQGGDRNRGQGSGGQDRGDGRGQGQGQRGGGRDSQRGGPTGDFKTDVPDRPYDVILARPTRQSATVSILSYSDATAIVHHGTQPGVYPIQTEPIALRKDKTANIELGGLQPDTRYHYQLRYRPAGSNEFIDGEERTCHTQRAPGSDFTFTVQADSHLDENTDPKIYATTLANALADKPDFHVDLGDTFMTGKRGSQPEDALDQYIAQRYYFGQVCHSAPLFFVLGNHDGEPGRDGADALRMRTTYIPNPIPDGFYSGNAEVFEDIGHPQNYYAWDWGDARFIVLDPYRYSGRGRGQERDNNWNRTLGETQYRWLKETLERDGATMKFVFIHHLVGGLDKSGRGGAEAATLYEWGGAGPDGRNEFPQRRPGWPAPIHQLLVENDVAVVFHGHDHFFARQELDGIIYQLVPQPGHPGSKYPRFAEEYGYREGDILGGSGHLRVRMTKDTAKVEYISSCLPSDERGNLKNRAIAFSYEVRPRKERSAPGR